ncbi:MAG: uroporphyrinogen decarboxylase family protein [bacterium]
MPAEMNARERWSLLLIDEFPDRPPVYPLITSHAATVLNCDLVAYCTNGRILAEAQLQAQRIYGHDGLSVFTDVGIIAEAMGSQYRWREFDVPILESPMVATPEKVEELAVPDPATSGRLPVYLEAIDYLYKAAGDTLPIFAFIPSPFTNAAGLRGVEDFLLDTILNPETAHSLLEISLEAALRLCDACILAGALPVLVDPLASGSVISYSTFTEFAHPYLKRLIAYLHRYDLDITLHICGDTSRLLAPIADTGADLFSFDVVGIQQVLTQMGEQVRLVGNLSPNSLLPSSHLQIVPETERILETGLQNAKGFVLSTGCEVPIGCDPARLQQMIDIGKHSHYDQGW